MRWIKWLEPILFLRSKAKMFHWKKIGCCSSGFANDEGNLRRLVGRNRTTWAEIYKWIPKWHSDQLTSLHCDGTNPPGCVPSSRLCDTWVNKQKFNPRTLKTLAVPRDISSTWVERKWRGIGVVLKRLRDTKQD
jgi:hypothetical protein